MAKRNTKAYTVHAPKIKGVSDEDFACYIGEAVRSWYGQAVAPVGDDEPDAQWLMAQKEEEMNRITVSYKEKDRTFTEVGSNFTIRGANKP